MNSKKIDFKGVQEMALKWLEFKNKQNEMTES